MGVCSIILRLNLKCENILRAQITDFGLALKIEKENFYTDIRGTVGYQAPEQLAPKGKWDQRINYFVTDIIFLIMVTGRHPF
ncbi:hypothetical protein HA402_014392 [Bradysia odoriphaga]|nr:hypothetical protein HA402_014392 [Bradysia odoriphaga]